MATQHAGSSTAEPREDTPLLQADAHSNPDATAGQTNDNGDNNGRLSQSANAITSSTHPPLARIDKAIFIMSALLITTAIISFAFYLANIRLLAVGSRFGFLEFQIHGRMTFFCWVCFPHPPLTYIPSR